jgi:hypothetical protein
VVVKTVQGLEQKLMHSNSASGQLIVLSPFSITSAPLPVTPLLHYSFILIFWSLLIGDITIKNRA